MAGACTDPGGGEGEGEAAGHSESVRKGEGEEERGGRAEEVQSEIHGDLQGCERVREGGSATALLAGDTDKRGEQGAGEEFAADVEVQAESGPIL